MRSGRDEARRAAQRGALQVLLPGPLEVDLLRVVLWEGEAGRAAWRTWHARVGDPVLAFERRHAAHKGLVPLLHVAAQRNRLDLPPAFATYLRAAYFREELRGNAYRRVLGEVLEGLAGAGLRPLVLKGSALAQAVYDDPDARHCHGIELLVRRAEAGRAAADLPALGFRPSRPDRPGRAARWEHASGLPLVLRTRLLEAPYADAVPNAALWSSSVCLPLAGATAQTLGREHALLQVGADAAMSGTRSTLRWACDAWLLLRRAGGFEWPLLLDALAAARLAPPLAAMLDFLAGELAAPVPPEVLQSVAAQAARSDDLDHELALLGALVGDHGRMRRAIVAMPGWSNRLAVLRPLIAPSPSAVRALEGSVLASFLPLYYAARPARYLARRLLRLRPAWALRH